MYPGALLVVACCMARSSNRVPSVMRPKHLTWISSQRPALMMSNIIVPFFRAPWSRRGLVWRQTLPARKDAGRGSFAVVGVKHSRHSGLDLWDQPLATVLIACFAALCALAGCTRRSSISIIASRPFALSDSETLGSSASPLCPSVLPRPPLYSQAATFDSRSPVGFPSISFPAPIALQEAPTAFFSYPFVVIFATSFRAAMSRLSCRSSSRLRRASNLHTKVAVSTHPSASAP